MSSRPPLRVLAAPYAIFIVAAIFTPSVSAILNLLPITSIILDYYFYCFRRFRTVDTRGYFLGPIFDVLPIDRYFIYLLFFSQDDSSNFSNLESWTNFYFFFPPQVEASSDTGTPSSVSPGGVQPLSVVHVPGHHVCLFALPEPVCGRKAPQIAFYNIRFYY